MPPHLAIFAVLAVSNWTLQDYEDGPPVAKNHVFHAGKTVYVSFQIAGYGKTEEDRIYLTYQIRALSPSQELVAPPTTGEIQADLAPEDKRWLPKVRYQVQIPPIPEPGAYRIELQVNDKISGTKVLHTDEFKVVGRPLTRLDSLAILNFRFLRSENASDPLPQPPAVHRGDTIWARFDIAGFKLGPKNRYDVRYGVALRNEEGKVLFSDPAAAGEKDESFYPKIYIPGVISLRLDRTLRPGKYVVVISAADAIGEQNAESEFPFTIK
ncbi:MAG TPA: hypothetical protein VMZ52_16530 [Bryobacteraceae bacterium]|nr:hypothetical protein [Bryobacteraceae bacterium]